MEDWYDDDEDSETGEEYGLDDDEFDYEAYVRDNHEKKALTDLPKIWRFTAIGLLVMMLLFWVFTSYSLP